MLNKQAIEAIEHTIGYKFTDKQLISQAFTRSSYRNEHLECQDNELLEFIGDSVLSLSVVNILIDRYSTHDENGLSANCDEGDFSKLRSALVNKQFLAEQIKKLNLHKYLLVSFGDDAQGIRNKDSVLEDLLESIIGAVYLDTHHDLQTTEKIVKKILDIETFLNENDGEIHISYKNDVQELCQTYCYSFNYDTHQFGDVYISYCKIPELDICERGEGHNIKESENNAAKSALQKLKACFIPKISKSTITLENAINMLQEYCLQKKLKSLPVYQTINDKTHNDNSHTFIVRCYLNNRSTDGVGSRVKEAKKQAAYNMLKAMSVID